MGTRENEERSGIREQQIGEETWERSGEGSKKWQWCGHKGTIGAEPGRKPQIGEEIFYEIGEEHKLQHENLNPRTRAVVRNKNKLVGQRRKTQNR